MATTNTSIPFKFAFDPQHFHSQIQGLWHFVQSIEAEAFPEYGWKLHVSAHKDNAEMILQRVIPVLIEHRASFKFAASLDALETLNGWHAERTQNGKFLTVYPSDVETAKILAEQLHSVTIGFLSPIILGDRRYQDGIVYYRYGAFQDRLGYTAEGSLASFLKYGELLYEDNRSLQFNCPPWIQEDPFLNINAPHLESYYSSDHPDNNQDDLDDIVEINGYRFEMCITQFNKGGVYIASDPAGTYVVKEARNFVTDGDQLSAIEHLLHEVEILDHLANVPDILKVIDIFYCESNLYVVLEHIQGETLREYIFTHHSVGYLSTEQQQDLFFSLIRQVKLLHQNQVIHGDLSPNNIVLTESGLRLVDFGNSAFVSENRVLYHGTHYFRNTHIEIATTQMDSFSLAMLLFFIVTTAEPVNFDVDNKNINHQIYSCREHLRIMEEQGLAFIGTVEFFDLLINDTPLSNIEELFIIKKMNNHTKKVSVLTRKPIINFPDWSNILAVAEQDPREVRNVGYDLMNFYSGLAGSFHALETIYSYRQTNIRSNPSSACLIIKEKLIESIRTMPRQSAGYYGGSSGILHVLLKSSMISNTERYELNMYIANIDWKSQLSHDLMFGTSGYLYLLTCIHRNQLGVPDFDFKQRIKDICFELINQLQEYNGLPVWDELEGLHPLGFAHGTAGVVYALLHAWTVTKDSFVLKTVQNIIQKILDLPFHHGEACYFSAYAEQPAYYDTWCNGSVGYLHLLLTYRELTQDTRFDRFLVPLAKGVHKSRFKNSISLCHGLAGQLDVLLSLQYHLPSDTVLNMIQDCLRLMAPQIEGLWGDAASRQHPEIRHGYMLGQYGVLLVLLRQRHGGHSCLMPN